MSQRKKSKEKIQDTVNNAKFIPPNFCFFVFPNFQLTIRGLAAKEINEKKASIETVIEKKYLSMITLNKKHFYEEIKELNIQNYKILEYNVLKNSYTNVLNCLSNGEILYKKDEKNNIIKICSNKNCIDKCDKKQCYKSGLYYSLWNNARGIKTIYNLLLVPPNCTLLINLYGIIYDIN